MPVCSPRLLQELGTATFEEVLAHTALIHATTPSKDWAFWFQAAGIHPPQVENGFTVDTVQLAIEAAVLGLGVAFGRRPLVDLELDSGTLVALGEPCTAAPVTGLWGRMNLSSGPRPASSDHGSSESWQRPRAPGNARTDSC